MVVCNFRSVVLFFPSGILATTTIFTALLRHKRDGQLELRGTVQKSSLVTLTRSDVKLEPSPSQLELLYLLI
jgi:hypothetical protein